MNGKQNNATLDQLVTSTYQDVNGKQNNTKCTTLDQLVTSTYQGVNGKQNNTTLEQLVTLTWCEWKTK